MISHPARAFALGMLNSSLDDCEIEPFLDALVEQGYEGIAWHPRDGMRVPYATRAFWDGLDRIIGSARRRGLAVWYYDEFPFPSGMAGGLIPDEVSPGLHELRFERVEAAPNRDGVIDIGGGHLVALLRVRDGIAEDVTADSGPYLDTWVWGEWHNLYYTGTINVHEELHERGVADRYTRAYLPQTPLLEGDELYAIKSVQVKGRRGQAGAADVSRIATTDRFCELIFKPLAALARKHDLGAVPLFQDEVTFGAAWPWNEEIAGKLHALWGERFAVNLWALGEPGRPGWESARAGYRKVCAETIENGWFARVEHNAHALGLRTAGHLPGEESILGHCQYLGDVFKMLSHFDVPGYDIISSTLPDGINRGQATGAKVVQSSAWLQKKTTMVEAFGANGFALTVQKQRSILAWLACHDLMRVFDHSTYVSSHGSRKYDAPPLSTRFEPMMAGRGDLWRWHARLCDLFQQYRFVPRTLVVFPVSSFARYTLGEQDRWQAQGSLLETWFHTLCAAAMDCVFLPVEDVAEIQPDGEAFTFRGDSFESLWLPPVESLRDDVWELLGRFTEHPHFYWCVPDLEEAEFNGALGSFGACDSERGVAARNLVRCSEAEMLQSGAGWFAQYSHFDREGVMSRECVLQSVRIDEAGHRLRVVINPHDREVDVAFGAPHAYIALDGECTRALSEAMTLAPREVLLLHPSAAWTAETPREVIEPREGRVRFAGQNALSLTTGIARLQGEAEVAFKPEPVSSLWDLGLDPAFSDAVFAAPYSREPLSAPRRLGVEFSLQLDEALEELAVLLDADSAPPAARMLWDGTVLQAETKAVFDTLNTVYAIPAAQLTPGMHRLTIEADVTAGTEGVLERPILIGRFLADGERLQAGGLRAMSAEWQAWNGESWPQLGVPEASGPLEYEWVFEAPDNCDLELPDCIGVAEVWADDRYIGRSSWAPRRLDLGELSGETTIRVQLSGSWNNVFSRLNRLQNGFTAKPLLLRQKAA